MKFTVIYSADAEPKSDILASVPNWSIFIPISYGNSRVLSIYRVGLADVDPS